MRALVAAAVAVGATAAVAGAALSPAAYRARADAVCTQERAATISRLHSAKNLTDYLGREVPVLRAAYASLAKLAPPPKLAALHKQVVAVVRGEANAFRALHARAEAGKLTEAQWQNDAQLQHLNVRELALWKALGAKGCANP